ncbi:hypothetical protein A4X09_0g7517 [Tilletia walkeri]|uniref:Uncharacterized protein n=1 Tax=Tilletia walkeri TaxID=117179 RepID=A0A8X7N1R6_9BASI|nr:hypothetical protein A4X09_0g7517 [Tilletia walkeri]
MTVSPPAGSSDQLPRTGDSASSNVASAPTDASSSPSAAAVKPSSKVSCVATEAASKAFAAFSKGRLSRNRRHMFCRVRLLLRSGANSVQSSSQGIRDPSTKPPPRIPRILPVGEITPEGAQAWKEHFGTQVEQARQAARDAILNALNKEAAQQIALGAEKWLLEAVKFDGEKLGRGEDSTEDELEGQIKLSIEQKKKLNEMGKTLRKRIAAREAALKKKEKAEKKVENTHDEL